VEDDIMAIAHAAARSTRQPPEKAQPRYLTPEERVRPCSAPDCSTPVVSGYKQDVYCAPHLFKTLQEQWRK